LERAKGGGFVVRSFTYRDVIDAIEFRGVLEGTAARLAAESGIKPEGFVDIKATLALLDDCFSSLTDKVDFDTYAELNAAFHDELADLCPSAVLRRELERAKALPFASPSAFLPDKLDITAFTRSLFIAQNQHTALVAAIEAREGARAEAIAREHARIALNNLEFVLSERSDLISQLPSLAIVVD
ncbi:MAG: GntR family transcriptional regulator, partial [Rhodobacteraceae bacterium]|nr:GntR family transcriptional regulator [Paracoccaceae bacterium]